jgi:acyl transferase domain-containing protein
MDRSLTEQTRQVVNMEAALLALKDGYTNENTTWIECGPQGHILMMIANTLRTSPDKLIASSSKVDDGWTTISAGVEQAYNNGLDLNSARFQEEFESALKRPDAAYEVQEAMEYQREGQEG